MVKLPSRISAPTALLCVLLVLTQIIVGLYLSRELELPPSFVLLSRLGLMWVLGWWLQTDSRKHSIKWVYDIGLFLYIAWPFIMPYYLFKTRGIKALLTILVFAVIYLGAYLVGVVVYVLLTP
jgi:hypothetical protein